MTITQRLHEIGVWYFRYGWLWMSLVAFALGFLGGLYKKPWVIAAAIGVPITVGAVSLYLKYRL